MAEEGNSEQQQGATPAAKGATPDAENQQGVTPVDFDSWLGGQDEAVKGLVNGRLTNLASALETERNDRKELQRQLTSLQKIGNPTELKSELEKVQASLTAQEERNAFNEAAHAQGVTNLRLAYLAAKDAQLLGKKTLWDDLKGANPELFRKTVAPTGAGNGSGARPSAALTMNELLRGS